MDCSWWIFCASVHSICTRLRSWICFLGKLVSLLILFSTLKTLVFAFFFLWDLREKAFALVMYTFPVPLTHLWLSGWLASLPLPSSTPSPPISAVCPPVPLHRPWTYSPGKVKRMQFLRQACCASEIDASSAGGPTLTAHPPSLPGKLHSTL